MLCSFVLGMCFRYCQETNSGSLVIPTSVDDIKFHAWSAWQMILRSGIPSVTTWAIYALFFVVQIVLAMFMPGVTMYGLPTQPHGVRLPYLCNGYTCYYLCLFGALLVHFTGVFNLTYIVDHYGEFLIASMLIGDVTSLMWYVYGLATADEYNGGHMRSGNPIYDFFMGTILYPRIGIVDIKMVAECRWSWTTLIMITLSCALKQYEQTGDISAQMLFMLFAHWLYSNATAKGEHCIPCTWDMFHENFGWMLNFWNVSGVPFMYTFQSLYILKNQAKISENYPLALIIFNYTLLIVAYYVFDSANSQKATIKVKVERSTFPQVPWGVLEEPVRFIYTPYGNLLVDGWYAFGRKLQYTGDILMALSWGLACGFHSLLPYWYCFFFTCMIIHRQSRDEVKCSAKYGKYWKMYTDRVPNVFFPSLAFYYWLFTGVHPADSIPEQVIDFELPSATKNGQTTPAVAAKPAASAKPSVTHAAAPTYAAAAPTPTNSDDDDEAVASSPTPVKRKPGRPSAAAAKRTEAGLTSPERAPRATTPAKGRTPSRGRATTPSRAKAAATEASSAPTPSRSRATTPSRARAESRGRGGRSTKKSD